MTSDLSIIHEQPRTLDLYTGDVFDRLMRVAQTMADSALCPDALCGIYIGEGAAKEFQPFPLRQIAANCFMVCEQAYNWGISPFAAAQSVSVVHGKLMWEGKLVAGVIAKNAGIILDYEWSGEGANMGVRVFGQYPHENKVREIRGTVADWKTTGTNSPWAKPGNWPRQLAYRGAREWARIHSPGLMLGVITDDERLEIPQQLREAPPLQIETGFTKPARTKAARKAAEPAPAQTTHESEEGASEAVSDEGDGTAPETEGEATGKDEPNGGDPTPEELALALFLGNLPKAQNWKEIAAALAAVGQTFTRPPTADERQEIRAAAWARHFDTAENPMDGITEDMSMFGCFVAGVANRTYLEETWKRAQTAPAYARLSMQGKMDLKQAVNDKLALLTTAEAAA